MDVNYGSISGQVVEYGYTGTYTGGVSYPYVLTSHGAADPNSIMADANFATTGTVELRIVSDFDSAKIEVDWQTMSDSQLWRDDINTLAAVTVNATTDTTDSAIIGWKTPDGTEGTFTATVSIAEPAADTTPAAFTFTDQASVEPGSVGESNAITISGADAGENIPVTITGGEYAVDAGSGFGAYTSTGTNVQLGYQIKVRNTASSSFEAAVNTTLTVGGVSDTFTRTTRAAVLPTQDVTLPDLNLGETDTGSIDLDDYFSGASSYDLDGIPDNSGFSFSGSVLSWNANANDIAASPFTLTATAFSADGSINDTFSVTVVDDLAPAVTVNALTTLDTTPIASGGAGDATAITLQVEGVDVTHTSNYTPTLSNGTWTQQLNELALGTYTMTVTGVDDAGNESVVSATLKVVEQIATSPRGLFQPLFRSLTGSVNQTLFR